MARTAADFVQRLRASGLLAEPGIDESLVQRMAEAPSADAAQLARSLVEQRCLTAYQASVLCEGRARRLVLGKYILLEELGEGGMGQVFKARHRYMDRVVALKTLPGALLDTPEAIARLRREARTAALLDHPNIVKAFDADECEGVPFLAMECVEGTDLDALLRQVGPLPVEQVAEAVRQAAEGLAYAHARGVIHRDIKPANLLLDRQGAVKILDMGLARLVHGSQQSSEPSMGTATGHLAGTIDYMSPEQAEDTCREDARSDIYSLGCTLWTLLTGRVIYPGQSVEQRLLGHLEAPIPSLRAVRAEVPASLDRLFQRMVAKRPEERPQSMEEVLEALANPQRCPGRNPGGFPSPGTRRTRVAVALAVCLAILLLAIGLVGLRRVPAVDPPGAAEARPAGLPAPRADLAPFDAPPARPSASPATLPILVADTVAEFSDVQGQDHWYYGYYDATDGGPYSQTRFVPLPRNDGRSWSISDRYWTRQSPTRFAPNGRVTSGGKARAEHWCVRRWISRIEGNVLIEGNIRKCGPGASGDGVTGRIVIDGEELWSRSIGAGDNIGDEFSVRGVVQRGSLVDFIVAPNTNDWEDTTVFTMQIFLLPAGTAPASDNAEPPGT